MAFSIHLFSGARFSIQPSDEFAFMNCPRQNKRGHQSDSRKNLFLRGVKIEKAIFYVKAILSIAAALRTCIRQSIRVSGFAARRAFSTDVR